jgi:hypothetical protein
MVSMSSAFSRLCWMVSRLMNRHSSTLMVCIRSIDSGMCLFVTSTSCVPRMGS